MNDSLIHTQDLECLTDGQRDCLRLVMLHLSSKEIARTLGISPHTVDQRLRVAVRNLGVTSRFEAARMLANHSEAQAAAPYQSLIYQQPQLHRVAANQQGSSCPANGSAGVYEAMEPALELNAAQASFPLPELSSRRGPKWSIPPLMGEEVNDLTLSERVLAVVLIALGSLMAFGTFLSGLDALSRLI